MKIFPNKPVILEDLLTQIHNGEYKKVKKHVQRHLKTLNSRIDYYCAALALHGAYKCGDSVYMRRLFYLLVSDEALQLLPEADRQYAKITCNGLIARDSEDYSIDVGVALATASDEIRELFPLEINHSGQSTKPSTHDPLL